MSKSNSSLIREIKMNIRHTFGSTLFFFIGCMCFLSSYAGEETAHDVLNKVALISAGNGSGSGFLCDIDGAKYLVTNVHVIDGGKAVKAQLPDGRRVKIKSFEIAEGVDLVRCRIDDQLPAFHMAKGNVAIGDSVQVLGNSDGMAVITSEFGSVVGVGDGVVEVDADFVHGNSGGPILNDRDEVVAVATYAVKPESSSEWVNKGTRFEKARRFGLRLDGRQWKTYNWKSFCITAELLNDVESVLRLIDVIQTDDVKIKISDERVKAGLRRVIKVDKDFSEVTKEIETIRKEKERVAKLYSVQKIRLYDGKEIIVFGGFDACSKCALEYLNEREDEKVKKSVLLASKGLEYRKDLLNSLLSALHRVDFPKGPMEERAQALVLKCKQQKERFEKLRQEAKDISKTLGK